MLRSTSRERNQARLLLLVFAMPQPGPGCEISIVLPFADDEEIIGTSARRLAEMLRQANLTFELLAIDEDSGDNSHAVLALVRAEVPELRVIHAPSRGKGVDTGALRAVGRTLLILTPSAATNMDGIAVAIDRVRAGQSEAEVVFGRYTVVERLRASIALRGVKASGDAMHRRLLRRLQLARLNVSVSGVGTQRNANGEVTASRRGFSAFVRFL
jgi:hypothetical protein